MWIEGALTNSGNLGGVCQERRERCSLGHPEGEMSSRHRKCAADGGGTSVLETGGKLSHPPVNIHTACRIKLRRYWSSEWKEWRQRQGTKAWSQQQVGRAEQRLKSGTLTNGPATKF